MALLVKPVESGLSAEVTQDGHQFTLTYDVTGLVSSTREEKIDEALTANDGSTAIPALGAVIPVSGRTAIVVAVKATPLQAPNSMRVEVTYSDSSDPSDHPKLDSTGVLELFPIQRVKRKTRDKDGNLMRIGWSGDILDVYPDRPASVPVTISAVTAPIIERDIEVSLIGVRLTLRRTAAQAKADANTYQGKLNSDTWSGYTARKVLCFAVHFDEAQGDPRAIYELHIDPDGWDEELEFRLNGQIPANISVGNGIEVVDVLPEVAFIGLPVSF